MFSEALSPTNLLNRPTGMLIYYTFTILAVQAAWAMSVVEWRSRKQWIYGRTLLAYSAVFASLVLTLLAGLLPLRGIISLPAIVGPALALFDTVAIILLCWAFQSRIIGDPRAPSYLGWNLAGAGFLSLLFTLILLPWQRSGAPLASVPAWQSQIWYAWQALLCLVACYLIYYRRRDQTGLQVISFGILAAGRLLAAGLMPGALQWSQLLGFPLLTISLYLNIVRDLKEFADELQAISTPASRQTRQLVFALESARTTAASLELGALLPRLAETVALAMNADHAGIFLTSPKKTPTSAEAIDAQNAEPPPPNEGQSLLVAAFYDPLQPRDDVPEQLALDEYPAMVRSLAERETQRLDAHSEAREARTFSRDFDVPDLGDIVIQPLALKGEVVGILFAARHSGHERFAGDEVRLCDALAGQIAIAIINARFYRRLEEQAVLLAGMLELQQQETSKNQAILESIVDGVVVCSTNGHITLINEAAERLLDSSRDELLDQPITKLYARLGLEEFPRFTRARTQAFRSDSLGSGSRVLQGSIAEVQTAGDDYIGQVIVFRDVTSELRAERAKSEFLATVSHELRTPVTSIKGFADLLAKGMAGDIPASVKGFLETISLNADRMARLVDNILYVSEAEQGEVPIHLHRANVATIIERSVKATRPLFVERRIEVTLEIEEDLPQVEVDPAGFRQMLDNLLQNACRFTPRGGHVRIKAALHLADDPHAASIGAESDTECLLVTVRDSGVGIEPKDHDRVFERFYRAPNPLSVEAGGAGIGLTIVKSLVEAHGGRVWVEGEIGEGSCFNVILPIVHPK